MTRASTNTRGELRTQQRLEETKSRSTCQYGFLCVGNPEPKGHYSFKTHLVRQYLEFRCFATSRGVEQACRAPLNKALCSVLRISLETSSDVPAPISISIIVWHAAKPKTALSNIQNMGELTWTQHMVYHLISFHHMSPFGVFQSVSLLNGKLKTFHVLQGQVHGESENPRACHANLKKEVYSKGFQDCSQKRDD